MMKKKLLGFMELRVVATRSALLPTQLLFGATQPKLAHVGIGADFGNGERSILL